jgi:heme exporter protein A
VLSATGLECVRGEHRLFAGLGFALQPGTLLAVRGANGSGKTSLLRMLCGLLPPAAGRIAWKDTAIAELGEEYHVQLAYLGHHNAIKEELTAPENLSLALRLAGIAADPAQCRAALEWSGLGERRRQACATLSQGQRRRVALARIWLSRPRPLWILDEPFTALDVAAVDRTRALIEAHLAGGGVVALTTHQEVPIAAPAVHTIDLSA